MPITMSTCNIKYKMLFHNKLKFNKTLPEAIICPICLECIDTNEICYTECFHYYHYFCIHKWIIKYNNSTCPECNLIQSLSYNNHINNVFNNNVFNNNVFNNNVFNNNVSNNNITNIHRYINIRRYINNKITQRFRNL